MKYARRNRFAHFVLMAALPIFFACSPKYNWREVHGKEAPFVVLLPDKPASMSRQINLEGEAVTMTMTAAEVDGVSFAVGDAQLADARLAPAALKAMETALLNNINGKIKREQLSMSPPTAEPGRTNAIDMEAVGARRTGEGNQPLLLIGHFAAKETRVYQVIVLGNEKAVPREEAGVFFSSFKLD